MDQVAYNLPLQQNLPPPDYASDQMNKAVSLANVMDQRRANVGAMQRAASVRDVFSDSNTVGQGGSFTPEAIQQVAQYDPDKAMEMQKGNYYAAHGNMFDSQGNMYDAKGNLLNSQAQTNPQTAGAKANWDNARANQNNSKAQSMTNDQMMKIQNQHLNTLANYWDDFDPNSPTAAVDYQAKINALKAVSDPNNGYTAPDGKTPRDPMDASKYLINSNELNNLDPNFDPTSSLQKIAMFKARAQTYQQNLNTQQGQQKIDNAQDLGQQKQDLANKAEADKTAYNNQIASIKAATQRAGQAKMTAALGGKLTDLDKQELGDVKTELTGKGTIGLQSKKIDTAIDTRAALNRYFDPQTGQYDVPKSGYAELTSSLSNLLSVSGGGAGSEAQRQDLQQRTAAGDLNGVLSYWSGVPKNATTQDALKIVANQIDAIGLQSEKNRNNYFPNIAKKYTDIGQDPQRALAIAQHAGNNYSDFLKQQYETLGLPMDGRTLNSLYQNQANQGATSVKSGSARNAGGLPNLQSVQQVVSQQKQAQAAGIGPGGGNRPPLDSFWTK
jgi:hypothetical protein